MRLLPLYAFLALLQFFVTADPQQSDSSTVGNSAPDPNACGSIVNKVYSVVNATQAYDCLRSVPFNKAVASQLLSYINGTLQFQSTLPFLANPPPGYQQPAVDLVAGLAQIKENVDINFYRNEYDFEIALHSLINAAHDDHLTLKGGIMSAFAFGSPYDIVSLSKDGIEAPKIYIAEEIRLIGVDDTSYQPSAIASINGQDVFSYLSDFAAKNSIGKLEPHTDWNMLMRSGALDTQGHFEVFFGNVMFYPGDTITLSFENGTVLPPSKWKAIYQGPSYTGPLQTGGDFYNFFVLSHYPASYNSSQEDDVLPPTSASSDSSSFSKPPWDGAYPTPVNTPDKFLGDEGLPRTFFLLESSLAVLSMTTFSTFGEQKMWQFVHQVKTFLKKSKEAGLKKVIIDLQQNTGGEALLAIEIFKLFFPSHDPYTGSRRRAHPMADALGNTITQYWKSLNKTQFDYHYLLPNEWMIDKRLSAETADDFTTWNEYFRGGPNYGSDNFTKTEIYNLTDRQFTEAAASGLHISNLYDPNDQPYSAGDIVMLSDGICSSACAVFMELMQHQAKVRTVVVGGRPDYTPMQASGGSRGAAVYAAETMDTDIAGASRVNLTGMPPSEHAPAFSLSYASVNLRDQLRWNETSNTPLQFRYLPANCRIFFTPSTWYNYSHLWNYTAQAAWQNPSLCIASSTSNPSEEGSPPKPYEVLTGMIPPGSQDEMDENDPSPMNDEIFSHDLMDSPHLAHSPWRTQCDPQNARSCGNNRYECREVVRCIGEDAPYMYQCLRKCTKTSTLVDKCKGNDEQCIVFEPSQNGPYAGGRTQSGGPGICQPIPQWRCPEHSYDPDNESSHSNFVQFYAAHPSH